MLKIRKMSMEDLRFAVELADKMHWNLGAGDFEFMMELEPEGCFVLLNENERIGIVTTISYGNIGWFGNLLVKEEQRGKGGGTLLADNAVRKLAERNVKTVGLYAYVNRIPFYQRLGFLYDSDFIVLTGRGFASQTIPIIRQSTMADLQKIMDCDYSCLGISRRRLLEPILSDPDNLCYLYDDSHRIGGYVVAKAFRGKAEIGPMICRQECRGAALDLVCALLTKLAGFEVTMCIPEKQTELIDMLKGNGFNESFRVARMFHGPPFAKDCAFVAESLERG